MRCMSEEYLIYVIFLKDQFMQIKIAIDIVSFFFFGDFLLTVD